MSASNQNFGMVEGESKDVRVTVVDQDGATLDLSGAAVQWEAQADLQSSGPAAITKATGGFGITLTAPTQGVFSIRLNPSDTMGLSGVLYHEARVTDSAGNVATVLTGRLTIQKTAIG